MLNLKNFSVTLIIYLPRFKWKKKSIPSICSTFLQGIKLYLTLVIPRDIKLIGDVFNLIMWLYLKTVFGSCIRYLTRDQSVDVINRVPLSWTITSSSFSFIPYAKILWGVYISPLSHACTKNSTNKELRHGLNFQKSRNIG